MTDETTETPPTGDPSMRLVPLSDIDAFVEVRAGAILDEAAILAIQFLGGGDRNNARTAFVRMAMEHFDAIGTKYDDIRWETMMRARREAMRRAREKATETAQDSPAPETAPPTEEDKKD